MGDRGVVRIADTGVVLYTHWGATALPETLATALGRRERWHDPAYLARIIFSEMVRGALDRPTGFGITTTVPGDAWRILRVDCEREAVEFVAGGGFHDDDHAAEIYGFGEFVRKFEAPAEVEA